MLIKIIGDAAIALSGMRGAICGLEGRSHFMSFSQRAGDPLFGMEKSIA
ncbi:hypothetical protein [Microcoleus sp. Pol12B4]